MSGTTIVVGASGDGSGAGSGAAYVFVWNGTAWVQQARLLPSNGEYNEAYGWSVAIDGDTIIVGAQFADRYALVSGAAYAYERTGTTWVERILVPTDIGQGDRFGWSVSVSGNTACVSSMEDQNSGFSASGSVYLFTRGAAGWSVQQKLFAPVPGYTIRFGSACAIDGDTLAVGSIYANSVGLGHVFVRGGATWALQQTLQVAAPAALRIGDSVDVRGDVVVLGAPESNPGNLTRAGAAYVFTRAGATWTERMATPLPVPAAGDELGRGVATDGTTVLAGGPSIVTSRPGAVAIYGTGVAPAGPPGPPTNVQASASGNTLSMSWGAPSSGAAPTGYTLIVRATAGGAVLGTLPLGNVTSFTAAAPNGVFAVTLTATNASGTGPESSSVTITLPSLSPPPSAPTNLAATVLGSTATVTWTAPASGGPVGSYALVAGLAPGFAVPLGTLPLPAGSTTTVIPGIPAGTYYLPVLAQNAGGSSAASNEVAITVTGAAAPGAPTLNAPTVTGSTVGLSWTAGAGGAPTSYLLTALTAGGVVLGTVPLAASSASFPGVPSGSYLLRVVAVNGAGSSPASNTVTLVVP